MHSSAQAKTFAAGSLAGGAGFYAGFSLRETAGAAAVVRLWDNTSAAGKLIATIALPASSSKDFSVPAGVAFATGLFAEIVSGTVEGSVYIG